MWISYTYAPLSQYAPNKHHARTYTHLFYAFVSTHTFIHFSGLPFPCEAHQNAPCHAHLLFGAMPTERWPCLIRTNTHQNKHREYVIHKSGNTHMVLAPTFYSLRSSTPLGGMLRFEQKIGKTAYEKPAMCVYLQAAFATHTFPFTHQFVFVDPLANNSTCVGTLCKNNMHMKKPRR